ncbi:MAG: phosphate acetyltransferase [Elusimicrobiota bacterium]|nr:phosphate acetyltransferase [Elusimicrobiota bacterium]
MDFKNYVVSLAKKNKRKIILPESFDVRILIAAQKLTEDGIANIVLPTENEENVRELAKKSNINLAGIEIIKIDRNLLCSDKISDFVSARSKKGMTEQDALTLLDKPLYFSMMYLKSGKCDACVCGAVYDTADVLRAGIYVVGTANDIKMISSYFIMIPPEKHPLVKEPVFFADCGVNPEPQASGLRDIAVSTVKSFKKLFPDKNANIAMLSFSTKGSAKNKILDKVIEATDLVKNYFENRSDVNIDGEFQFDASIVPSVAQRKAPDSKIAGNANILIFPDLNSGNISYKVAERLGGFQAIGPIIQGLSLPVSDLSRGASVQDIYLVCAINGL